MESGWIKMHRQLKEWQHYQEPTVLLVWIDLLLSANSKPTWARGEQVMAGQVVTSVTTIMETTGLSKHTVIEALKKLEQTGEISREKFGNGTKITIANFDKFQASGAVGGAKNAPRKSKEGNEAVQQAVQKMHQSGAVGGAKNAPIQEYKKEEERIINTPLTPAHETPAPIERPNPRMMDAKIYGTFQNVKLTDSEMQTLRMRLFSEGHDEDFLQRCIERLSAYIAQEGKHYHNHLAAILNWAKVAVQEDDRRTGAAQPRPSAQKPTAADNDERRRVWLSLTEEERQQYLSSHNNKPPYDE